MERENSQHILLPEITVDSRGMVKVSNTTTRKLEIEQDGERIYIHSKGYYIERDTDKSISKIDISSSETQISIPINTIARLNALLTYSSCKIHANVGNIWVPVDLIEPTDNYLVVSHEDIVGRIRYDLYEWSRPFILYLGENVQASISSVNILLRYGHVRMYTILGNIAWRINRISQIDDTWIRVYTEENGDILDLVKKYYEALPFRIIGVQHG